MDHPPGTPGRRANSGFLAFPALLLGLALFADIPHECLTLKAVVGAERNHSGSVWKQQGLRIVFYAASFKPSDLFGSGKQQQQAQEKAA